MSKRINRGRPYIVNRRRDDVRRSGKVKSTLNRDFAAMNQVWKMLQRGAIRALGEIGRQY